jgi:hypothetical protein
MPDQTWEQQHPDCEPPNPNMPGTGVYRGGSFRAIINKDQYRILIENETESQVDVVIAKRK